MNIKDACRRFLESLPPLNRLMADRRELHCLKERMVYPPGHFYSPLPNLDEVKDNDEKLFSKKKVIHDVRLRRREQLELLRKFRNRVNEFPFPDEKSTNYKYFLDNNAYSYNDAFAYWSMLLWLKPKRVIEVGLGMSSCLLLDTNQHFLDSSIDCILIDPFPERFKTLCGDDLAGATLVSQKLQDSPASLFEQLEPNDILFIDSSHVAKTGSDVNHYLFEILPRLRPGVVVHIHDILYPFEYPRDWVLSGTAWNEVYAIRALLQGNSNFDILFWNHFLATVAEPAYRETYPDFEKDLGGSLWIKKIKTST